MDFTLALKNVSKEVNRNSPTILTALGVAGLVSTVILAIRATPKAEEILYHEAEFRLEQWSEQTGEDSSAYPTDMFLPLEIIELTWKEYIPTAVMGAATIACMIGSNHISLRRNAALASLLTIAETTLREYQTKVVEQIGEKKEEKIRGEIAQEKLDKNPMNEKTIVLTGKGDYPCFDNFSARYFRSNIDFLQKKQNEFNQKLLRNGWLSINEFYYEIGLDPIELGEEMGWIAERQLMELKLYTKQVKGTGEPCLVIDYYVSPHHI